MQGWNINNDTGLDNLAFAAQAVAAPGGGGLK